MGIEQHNFFTGDLNKIVENKFTHQYMNDSKWDKLIDQLTDYFESGLFLNFKLIHKEAVFNTYLYSNDDKPFFEEPIIYKELEWVEIPLEYEWYINKDNQKAGMTVYKNDLNNVFKKVSSIGLFEIEQSNMGLRIFGYK